MTRQISSLRNVLCVIVHFGFGTQAYTQTGSWLGKLHRSDGEDIVFNFDWKKEKGKDVWVIKNATERIRVDSINSRGDSIIVQMPVFESWFSIRYDHDSVTGFWYKRGSIQTSAIRFSAARAAERFHLSNTSPINIATRWSVRYDDDSVAETVAELSQHGSKISGTFLNPTGDYRYLEGIATGDSLLLSSFDGSHSFLFKAKIEGNTMTGMQFSGPKAKKSWTARADSNANISDSSVAMALRPGEDSLHFAFKDMNGKMISIKDPRFRGKVVIIQIMGSWCPNCMDETAYLSDYYNKNKSRGVEIIGLAYEYTTDWQRSVKSLQKFRNKFRVNYPILITGVAVGDSLKTEKTLPELTPIKVFPSSVVIDKKGKVRKLDTGFNGPATGGHYMIFKQEFETTINSLLAE